jgi:hypothetical protein
MARSHETFTYYKAKDGCARGFGNSHVLAPFRLIDVKQYLLLDVKQNQTAIEGRLASRSCLRTDVDVFLETSESSTGGCRQHWSLSCC